MAARLSGLRRPPDCQRRPDHLCRYDEGLIGYNRRSSSTSRSWASPTFGEVPRLDQPSWMQPVDEMLIVPLLPAAQPPYERRHPQPQAQRSGEYAANLAKINGPNLQPSSVLIGTTRFHHGCPQTSWGQTPWSADRRHTTPPKPPADFRSEYDPMQVSAHKRAVLLFER